RPIHTHSRVRRVHSATANESRNPFEDSQTLRAQGGLSSTTRDWRESSSGSPFSSPIQHFSIMAEGGSVRTGDNGGGGGGSSSSSSSRSKRPLRRQQQQQQQQQQPGEVPEATTTRAGSKRRRGEASDGTNGGQRGASNHVAANNDVAPPPAKQPRGLYRRVSGLVGRAVGLLTRVASAAAEDDDLEAEGGAVARGEESTAVEPEEGNEGTPAAAAADPPVGAAGVSSTPGRGAAAATSTPFPSSRHGGVGGGADVNPTKAAFFSPGVGQRREGLRRQTRRGGAGAGTKGNAISKLPSSLRLSSSARRASGDGLGSTSLRGSTAGDGGGGGGRAEELGLPPVPPFYKLEAASPAPAGRVGDDEGEASHEHGGIGVARSLRSGRVIDGVVGVGGGAAPAAAAVGSSDISGRATDGKIKRSGKGPRARSGHLGADDMQEEEEEEEEGDDDGDDDEERGGGGAALTATERRDLYRSLARGPYLSAWESLYLLRQLNSPEANALKERCLKKYKARVAENTAAA
ncbi:unnamed protein product, partial [Ectocarpus sp. 13 AM-2016]